jgi:hypothetical protein
MSEASQYLSLVAHKIQMLIRNIEALKEQDYPSVGPAVLAEVLIRILSRFFEELRRLSTEIGERPDEDIVLKAHTIHYSTVMFIPRLVEVIISADISSPVGGLVEAYGRICNQARFGSQLILYPSWEYNASYREIMNILRGITENVSPDSNKGIFDGTYKFVPIITFPASEQEITLRQALIAHEVGHFIDQSREMSDKVLQEQIFPPDAVHNLSKITDGQPGVSLQRLTDFLNETILYWIREMVADYLGVAILGPAYLFAFEDFTFTTHQFSPPAELTKTHPPAILRLKLMARLCQRIQMDRLSEEYATDEHYLMHHIKNRLQNLSDAQLPKISRVRDLVPTSADIAQLLFSILTESMEIATAHLNDTFDELLEEPWTCSVTDIRHALGLRLYLEQELTPSEITSENSILPTLSAVMNAGWFYLIEFSDEFNFFTATDNHITSDPNIISDRYLTVQKLIAKAIESMNFQREYLRRGGRLEG